MSIVCSLLTPLKAGMIGDKWRALSPEEKAVWKARQEQARLEHLQKHPGYQYRPKQKETAVKKLKTSGSMEQSKDALQETTPQPIRDSLGGSGSSSSPVRTNSPVVVVSSPATTASPAQLEVVQVVDEEVVEASDLTDMDAPGEPEELPALAPAQGTSPASLQPSEHISPVTNNGMDEMTVAAASGNDGKDWPAMWEELGLEEAIRTFNPNFDFDDAGVSAPSMDGMEFDEMFNNCIETSMGDMDFDEMFNNYIDLEARAAGLGAGDETSGDQEAVAGSSGAELTFTELLKSSPGDEVHDNI